MASITTPVQTQSEAGGLGRRFRANLQTYGLIGALIIIAIFFSWQTNGAFISARNFSNLFRQMTVTGFLSVGMVLVIVTGNIDLSVGKLAGFVSVIVAVLQTQIWPHILPGQEGLTALLTVIISLLVGTLVGVVQGYIIAQLRVPAFIVTLGGLWVFTGAILIVTQGKTISAEGGWFLQISQGYYQSGLAGCWL
jgi:D-xylose transport system permease protein